MRWSDVLVAFVCLSLVQWAKVQQASKTVGLKVTLEEKSPKGTVITDMANVFNLGWEEKKHREFKLIDQKLVLSPYSVSKRHTDLVQLDDRTGIITLRYPVNRDVDCRASKQCIIKVKAVMLPQPYFSFLNLDVVISDVNDHAPNFPVRPIEVNVSESVNVGDVINLDQYQARDLDSGNNSVIKYGLSNNNNYFQILQDNDETGRTHINLLVLKKLDYERNHYHHLTLTATDLGSPPQSDHVTLRIRVTDANDNGPVFEKQDYVVALRENMEPGSEIVEVRALDADSGENGRTVYYLGEEDSRASELVMVDRNTGMVTLKEKLDREAHDGMRIVIEASDCSATDQKTARTFLTLHVEDMNDNAPTININYIVDSRDNTAYISEESPIGTYLAYVSANDLDNGNNGEVILTIWTQKITQTGYTAADSGHFSLAADGLIGTGKTFDREVENRFKLVVSACDKGTPARCTFSNITIEILDENENKPVFKKSVYEVTLSEASEVGTNVITVSATDDDSLNTPALWKNQDKEIEESKNGDVVYSIDADERYVTIDSRSGKVTLIRPLDRERLDKIEVTVVATDGGEPESKSSSCTLLIEVEDVNDNNPIFTNPALNNSTVFATILNNDVITTIKVTDYDANANGEVHLSMESVDGLKEGERKDGEAPFGYFVLDTESGELRLNLSREDPDKLVGDHVILLQATDGGTPPLEARVNLIVQVSDSLIPFELTNGHKATPPQKFTISTEFLIIVISLAAATLLLIIVITVVVVKCKKDNKKVRTYNCRDAEHKSGWLVKSRETVSNEETKSTRTKLSTSQDTTAQVNEKEAKNQAEGSIVSSTKSKATRNTSDSTRGSLPDLTATSRQDYVTNYHVMSPGERPPTSLSTFSCEGKIAHAKIIGLIPPPPASSQNDGDSGRGDSDPDSSSFSGTNERDFPKSLEVLPYVTADVQGQKYDYAAPSGGSRCTEECLQYGHSDICWMPSPTHESSLNKATAHNHMQFQNEYNRVLETIEETTPPPADTTIAYEYEPDAMRENVRRSICRMASETRRHEQLPETAPYHYDITQRHNPRWSDAARFSNSLTPSPAPSSGIGASSQLSGASSSASSRSAGFCDVGLRHQAYASVTQPLVGHEAGVSLRETQEIIDDIEKLLVH